jgi:hypothetical protein
MKSKSGGVARKRCLRFIILLYSFGRSKVVEDQGREPAGICEILYGLEIYFNFTTCKKD